MALNAANGATPQLAASSGSGREQGARRAQERAHEAVAGEERGAIVAGDAACEQRMLERQKDAHVARGRIERADEGDDEQRPEVVERSEAEAGQDHEQGGGDQQRARVAPDAGEPDGQGEQGRAEQVAVASTPTCRASKPSSSR